MRPVLFHLPDFLPWIGGAPVPAYGILLVVGAVLAAMLFAWLCKRGGADGGKAFEELLVTVLVSVVASKVIGLLFQPESDASIWQLLANTGGVWYVGFLTGVAFLAWRAKALGLGRMDVLDRAAPAVALGHAFGRIGCLLAGCCWGRACDAPWAVTFTDAQAHARTGVPLETPLHPTQLYEATSELILCGLLVAIIVLPKKRLVGLAGLTYLLANGLVRFVIEMFRADPRGALGGLSTSQLIALALIAASGVALIVGWRHEWAPILRRSVKRRRAAP